MVNRTLIRSLEDEILEQELEMMFGDTAETLVLESLEDANKQFDVNQIVEGKIVEINDEFVVVDVGLRAKVRFIRTNGTKMSPRRKSAKRSKS